MKTKIWIMSDTHFAHTNIIRYCDRPANCDELMIYNIRRLVKPQDTFIHLGDFALCRDIDVKQDFLDQIPAKTKILIKGNHDKPNKIHKLDGWSEIHSNYCFVYNKIPFYLNHFPSKLPNQSGINLHGHIHNFGHKFHWDPEVLSLKINMSVELWNYEPVLIDDLVNHYKTYLEYKR